MHDSAQLIRSIIAMTLILKSPVFCYFCQFCARYGFDQGLWLAIFINSLNNAGFSLFKDNLIGYQSSILLNLVVTGLIILRYWLSSYFEMYLWCMIACCETGANYIFFEL